MDVDSAPSAAKLARANDVLEFEEREKVFAETMPQIMKQCRFKPNYLKLSPPKF